MADCNGWLRWFAASHGGALWPGLSPEEGRRKVGLPGHRAAPPSPVVFVNQMASADSYGHVFHAAAIAQVILLAGCAALTVALPTAHRARRMPVAHLTQESSNAELEVELDSDAEVMGYLTGRAVSRAEVERAYQRRIAAARKVPGLGFGSDSAATTSPAGGSCNRRTGRISRKSPARPTLASGYCAGAGVAAPPPRAPVSLSATASATSASTGSSPRPWRSTHHRGRR
jgi:hypothetical protein